MLLKLYELSPWAVAVATGAPAAVDVDLSGAAAGAEFVLGAAAAAAGEAGADPLVRWVRGGGQAG